MRIKLFFWLLCLYCSTLFSQSQTGGLNSSGVNSFGQNFGNGVQDVQNELSEYVNRARDIVGSVKNSKAIDLLLNGEELNLPMKLTPSSGDDRYALVLDSIVVKPTGTYAVLYMEIDLASDGDGENSEKLIFVGKRIQFSYTGGFTGVLELELGASATFSFGEGDGKTAITAVSDGSRRTFVEFDCDGFKQLNLEADVTFPESMMVKDDGAGNSLEEPVVGVFSTNIVDWDSWIAEIREVPNFQLTSLPEFTFSIDNMVFDHSDIKNAGGFSFPDNYTSPYGSESQLWKGFYCQQLSLSFPQAFNKSGNEARTYIDAYNLMIDESGFTGLIEGQNILDLGDVESKGFKLSLDRAMVEIVSNSLVAASLEGGVELPVSSAEEGQDLSLAYEATFSKNPQTNTTDFNFVASTESEITIDLWKAADVNLEEGSYLDVEVVNKKFIFGATLHGDLMISQTEGLDAPVGVVFQDLRVQTSKPFLDIGACRFLGAENLDGMPVQLNELGIRTASEGKRIGLDLEISANFQGDGGNSFGGGAGFVVWGEQDYSDYKWKFSDVELNKLCLNVDNGAFSFNGCIERYSQDADYGSGYWGVLQGSFQPGIEVSLIGIFGSKDSKRYWFVDAGVKFPTAIPIFSGVGINGFMGGAYYNMIQDPSQSGTPAPGGQVTELGQTPSGIKYVVSSLDANTLGIKAGLNIVSMPTDKVFQGDLTFEILFQEGGGVRQISFYGGIELFKQEVASVSGEGMSGMIEKTESDPTPPPTEAQVAVNWFTQYNVPEKIFSGNFEIFLNVAQGVVVGTGPSKRAGRIEVYFSPQDWYVYIGTPSDQLGVSVVSIFEINAYFDAGSVLPDPPMASVPSEFQYEGANFIDPSVLNVGSGFAFGARLSVGVDETLGGKKFNIFVKAKAIAGFDILIAQDREGVACDGINGEYRGINRWYATGQAYFGVFASLGFTVFGFGVDAFNASITAYLSAQLPNPTYLYGNIRVDVGSIDLGLFSIDVGANWDVSIGDECSVKDQDNSLDVIDYINPIDGDTVPVAYMPKVALKMVNEASFFMVYEGNNKRNYRINVRSGHREDFSVRCISCDEEVFVDGELEWNEDNMGFVFKPSEVYPGGQKMELMIHVRLERQEGENWVFQDIVDGDTVQFYTEEEDRKLDLDNIQYSYPTVAMDYFYKGEYTQGYIKTIVTPRKVFEVPQGYQYQVTLLEGNSRIDSTVNVQLNRGTKREFSFPQLTRNMKNSTRYKYALELVPISTYSSSLNDNPDNGEIYYENSEASTVLPVIEVFQWGFKTSRFNTLSEKFSSYAQVASVDVNVNEQRVKHSFNGVTIGGEDIGELEPISNREVSTAENDKQYVLYQPLIRAVAKTSDLQDYQSSFATLQSSLDTLSLQHDFSDFTFEGQIEIRTVNRELSVDYNVFAKVKYMYEWFQIMNQSYPVLSLEPKEDKVEYFMNYFLPGEIQPTSRVSLSMDLGDDKIGDI